MSNIVRAWKDETYRQSLSVEEQVILPANPAGEVDLTDEELETVYGAWSAEFKDNRQWNFSSGALVREFSCNQVFGGDDASGTAIGPDGISTVSTAVSNTNGNRATSTSTSGATGGAATASTGTITVPLASI